MHDTVFVPLHVPHADGPIGTATLAVADHLVRRGLACGVDAGLRLDAAARLTDRLEDVRESLAHAGLIGPRRDEPMPVRARCDGPEIARVDRSALRALGFWAEKIHVNGIAVDPGGGPSGVWLSLRARTAPSNPLAFDTLVAGGRPCDASRRETLIKEAHEEVGLDADVVARADFVRTMIVQYVSERGFHQELIAIYDLAIPADFRPVHLDGEIEESRRLPIDAVASALADGTPFKLSSRLVTHDLLSRLGRHRSGDASVAGS
ncbi:NUDIX domain-containing protein [Salinarimonas chemoclinalis]|uniref:NUDIX domain-containing protein n=1 Tax=Salinarimonas chemoclinalis TaxID=3241599 RepID=UPI0035571F6F